MKCFKVILLVASLLTIVLGTNKMSMATVLLEDEFSFGFNSSKWEVQQWNPDGSTYIDGTQLRCYPYKPPVENGYLNLIFSTYNPTAAKPGDSFYGSQIISRQEFGVTTSNAINIEFRSRIIPPSGFTAMLSGPLTSGFLYKKLTLNSRDEIDIEVLTKTQPEGPGVLTNSFVRDPYSAAGDVEFVPVDNYNFRDFHKYEIYWSSECIEWSLDGQLIRRETESIPTHDMALYFNTWAPLFGGFDRALDKTLKPAAKAADNIDITWQLDSVLVESFQTVDLDRNDVIDRDDLDILLANYNTQGTASDGDLDGDNYVGEYDLNIFLESYDGPAPIVPEPSSFVIMLTGLLAIFLRKRK